MAMTKKEYLALRHKLNLSRQPILGDDTNKVRHVIETELERKEHTSEHIAPHNTGHVEYKHK